MIFLPALFSLGACSLHAYRAGTLARHKPLVGAILVLPILMKGRSWLYFSQSGMPEFCPMQYLQIVCCFLTSDLTFIFCFVASGILKGFDQLLNLVLDGTTESQRGKYSTGFVATIL